MFFDELNNDEWERLSRLVADEPVRLNRRGRPRAETRVVVNAVLWILTTGNPWSKLPGRYPSGPTCRRRFEEWLVDGTMMEMIRVLKEFGRTFAYIPEPPAPVSAPRPEPTADIDRLRGVFWKNPESWHASPGAANVCAPGDPIAAMTRQLAGAEALPESELEPELDAGALQGLRLRAEAWAATRSAPSDPVRSLAPSADASLAGPPGEAAKRDLPRGTPWMNFASSEAQVDHYRGYTIYASAQPVAKLMYRAWTEIVKDGKRIERSGLIGPRFTDAQAARHFALDWGRDWIEGESRTEAVDRVSPIEDENESAAETPAVPLAPPVPASVSDSAASSAAMPPVPTKPTVTSITLPLEPVVKRIVPERRAAKDGRSEAKSSELLYQVG
ncbi:transposase [Trinickia violacea]|uniref:Transposase n=1 Tax=Trinickia violacea TaxID=2571746 RepID=A0A4P8J1F5_9BURK|nr:transposase [Trinickia violacea]